MLGPALIDDVLAAADLTDCPWATIYFRGEGTISGGAVTIEEASEPDYAGTWSPIGAAFVASTVSGGLELAVHLTVGAYAFIRLRASTPVSGGGTLTARICAIPANR